MKSLFVASAVLALAVASPIKRAMVLPAPGGPAPIIDMDQLSPIAIGPAFVDNFEPVAIGPAIVNPSPVVPPPASPLVQVILNVNANVAESPVAVDTPLPAPAPVQVVETAAPEPIIVVESAPAFEPVIVVDA